MWPMIIGAGLGALTNKKNPLEGALLGGAMGYGGGLLGGAEAANASIVGGGGEAFGSPLASQMTEQMGDFVPEQGLLSGLPSFKEVAGYAKPAGEALMVANAASNMFGSKPTNLQSHAPQSNPNASQALAQLYQPYQMQPRNRVTWG